MQEKQIRLSTNISYLINANCQGKSTRGHRHTFRLDVHLHEIRGTERQLSTTLAPGMVLKNHFIEPRHKRNITQHTPVLLFGHVNVANRVVHAAGNELIGIVHGHLGYGVGVPFTQKVIILPGFCIPVMCIPRVKSNNQLENSLIHVIQKKAAVQIVPDKHHK